jgi:hypothetical protein
MQIFFCSIRTALIYGPATIIEAEAPEERKLSLRAAWEVDYPFDEWEGYAVVVPERNSVWGLSHPTYNGEGEIVIEAMDFTPQPIPPQDRKIFDQPPRHQKLRGESAQETEAEEE